MLFKNTQGVKYKQEIHSTQGVKYRGPKPLVEDGLQRGISTIWNWDMVPYGHYRRKLILDWLKSNPEYYIVINRSRCPILSKDPDLKRLLKQGKLKMEKIRSGGTTTLSILVLNKEY